MLSGKKVLLRMPEKEDLEFVYKLINEEDNRQYLAVYRPMSKDEEEEWIKKVQNEAINGIGYTFIILDKKIKKPVGNCTVSRINPIARNGEIGITLLKKYQNKGYGTDAIKALMKFAFMDLNFHVVYISAIALNERGVHVYKNKLGFKYDGVLRERWYKNGKYWDQINFSLTRDEWEELHGAR